MLNNYTRIPAAQPVIPYSAWLTLCDMDTYIFKVFVSTKHAKHEYNTVFFSSFRVCNMQDYEQE